jgi:hypothetical protein
LNPPRRVEREGRIRNIFELAPEKDSMVMHIKGLRKIFRYFLFEVHCKNI